MKYKVENLEAERAVVASIVRAPEDCRSAVMALDPEWFSERRAEAIVRAYQADGVSDEVELSTRAANWLADDPVKLSAYIVTAKESPSSPDNIDTYAELVAMAARARRSVDVMNQAITDILEGGNPDNLCFATSIRLRELAPEPDARTLSTVAAEYYERVSEYHENPLEDGEVRGVTTGLVALNELTGGLFPGLVISGSRPSVGKTALWSSVALAAARQFVGTDRVVLYFTNEMSDVQLIERMSCAEAQIRTRDVDAGRLTQDQQAELMTTVAEIAELPLEIPVETQLHEILARCYGEPRPGLVIVDYLNKLRGGEGENRNQRFGSIASSLFDVALDLDVPVVLLAQLNRRLESRAADTLPVMEDLRDSGELEQLADVILMLHRVFDMSSQEYAPRTLKVVKVKDRLRGNQDTMVQLYLGHYGEVRDIAR